MARILVLGAGFAGLWSAVSAARALDEFGIGRDDVQLTLVNRDAWHAIRVRNYEADLRPVRIALDDVLHPIGVEQIIGEVEGIDFGNRRVACTVQGKAQLLSYDRLVFALGSQLVRPVIPGLAEYAFDIDTYEAAARLNAHIAALPERPPSPGRHIALVIGAGLTGIEAATELPSKMRASFASAGDGAECPRVILADHRAAIGSDMGAEACAVIEKALASLQVEALVGASISEIDASGAQLSTGEKILAGTIVWCAGMRANPLTGEFPVKHDRLGRIPVDCFMKVEGLHDVFAAGDVACAVLDDRHASVMSCQHARPMGRFAGHNAVCDLLHRPMLPLRIDWYVTCLDLGPWGAVYTEGWDRCVVATGAAAKRTKQIINCERISPPRSADRRQILDAAAPIVQAPPPQFR